MSSSANGRRRYRLAFSAAIGKALRRLQRQATREGRGEHFLRALRTIVDGLSRKPNDFGELLYRLPALRLRVCSVVVPPLAVHFAVSEIHPVVFIKDVNLLAES
jgi:hypothetical protein